MDMPNMPYRIYVKTPFGFDLLEQFDDFDEAWDEFNTLQAADPFHIYKLETDK